MRRDESNECKVEGRGWLSAVVRDLSFLRWDYETACVQSKERTIRREVCRRNTVLSERNSWQVNRTRGHFFRKVGLGDGREETELVSSSFSWWIDRLVIMDEIQYRSCDDTVELFRATGKLSRLSICWDESFNWKRFSAWNFIADV